MNKNIEKINVYCLCRLPEGDGLMVECDLCKEWFHSTCVKLPDDINESEWICPNCTGVVTVS